MEATKGSNKKYLFVTPYYEPNIVGGAEISTQLVAEGLKDFSIVLTAGVKDSIRQLNDVTIIEKRVFPLTKGWKKVLDNKAFSILDTIFVNLYNIVSIPRLENKYQKLIKQYDIDIVIVNTNIDALGRMSIWKATKKCGKKLILVLRDPLLLRKKICGVDVSSRFTGIVSRQLDFVDSIVAPSNYMIELYAKSGICKEKRNVIPNAVDITYRNSVFSKKTSTALYAGSLRKEKGILTLLAAFDQLIRSGRSYQLSLFGRGELEQECKGKEYVLLKEWVKREILYNEMSKVKVVVLPSEYPEAFGRVLIEAVYMGTLVVGSDAGGIPEILDHDTKYMYKAGNSTELASRISRIMMLTEQEYMMEINSLQKKFSKYSKEAYVKAWEDYLEKEIAEDQYDRTTHTL